MGGIGQPEIFLWDVEESRGYTAHDNREDFPPITAYAACDAALFVRNHKKHYRQAAVNAASRSARTLPRVSCTLVLLRVFFYMLISASYLICFFI
jgi:hypothetical protein